MNRKSFFASFVIIFTSILVSCSVESTPSSKVPLNKLLRYYHAMATDDATTYVSVNFYKKAGFDVQNNPFGEHVELDPPSTITFNGKPMNLKKSFWSGVVYKTKSEKWPKTFNFTWTDNKGRKHVNAVTMDTIHLKKDWLVNTGGRYAVVWNGAPVQKGEEVSVSIGENTNWNYSTKQAGARKVVIGSLPVGFNPLTYYRVEITRTLRIRLGDSNDFNDTQDGVYIKLIYTVTE